MKAKPNFACGTVVTIASYKSSTVLMKCEGVPGLEQDQIRIHLALAPLTAQGIAALTHTPGKELAKTVIVTINDEVAMAVLPASHQVNLSLLRAGAKAGTIRLATEREFKDRFPDCETGAMPPFGNLFGMKVFVDELLTLISSITHTFGLDCVPYS